MPFPKKLWVKELFVEGVEPAKLIRERRTVKKDYQIDSNNSYIKDVANAAIKNISNTIIIVYYGERKKIGIFKNTSFIPNNLVNIIENFCIGIKSPNHIKFNTMELECQIDFANLVKLLQK